MQATIITRAFRERDYGAVLRLWRRSQGVEIAEGDDRAGIVAYLRRNPGLSRVALRRQRIVGAVLCGHDGRRGLIYHLAVAPRYRGQGIGQLLVQECIDGLRARGIKRALILVDKRNRKGRTFWLRRGFEVISLAEPFGRDVP
ncbi:MAG TPA: GNAT family N-acetyltransferase [Candidatus Didemnitutus sp.]|nr:GNAT family N-acetyltransferase [Candidatus Didemnitutus sp.]